MFLKGCRLHCKNALIWFSEFLNEKLKDICIFSDIKWRIIIKMDHLILKENDFNEQFSLKFNHGFQIQVSETNHKKIL